ncbi:IS66 family insertion sequence element accessory protein TnpA [Candidatus Colwellia aromaticivorans]|uniref:IS66 family insertion sequence element accessory protein TnpA n=1 Tax=Candidatus Colwellia aromaticivorans TaxID=2267621 RepID=UPI000DF41378|nr:hypothetical protein [Candidatus Colwellia aromaticivorans]
MSRKTSDEWKCLVEKQITSGLSVPKFCDQYQLSTKYFYARKAIIAKGNNRTDFIQAKIITKQTIITQPIEYPIKLNLPVGELSFPHNISPAFIAELLNGLTHEDV